MSPKPPPSPPVVAPASALASPPKKEQPRTAPPVAETKMWRKGKGGVIATKYSSDSDSDLVSDDSICKKKRASLKQKKKLSERKNAPKEQGKKNNVGINVINVDDDKEDSRVFDDVIADGKREWEVVKIHPMKGYSFVYEHIYNIDIDWGKVNSVCLYLRLCVHRQPLTYFIPYLLLLDQTR